MKKLTSSIIIIALVLGLCQCKKKVTEIAPATPEVTGNFVRIRVNAGHGNKHIIYPATGAYVFQNGDKLYVGNHNKFIGTLVYQDGAFSGLVCDPVTTDYLHFYFLGGLEPSNIMPEDSLAINETTDFTVSISDQTGGLPVISYGHSTTKYKDEATTYACMLENKCGLVKLRTWPAPSTTENNTTVMISGMKTTAKIDFANGGIVPTATTGEVTLYKLDGSDPAERWAILLPQDETEATVSYKTQYNNDTVQTITLPEIKANSFYGGYSGISVGLEYVDLGLSSGRLWAACNIGSCTHEGFGTFFAWAETAPKSTYCWHSYKYAFNPKYYPSNPPSIAIPHSDDTLHHEPGSNHLPNLGFFKYNTKAAYFAYEGGNVTGPNGEEVGGPDGVSILDTEFNNDDVAVAKWGNGWHIPTREEWNTLIDETTQTREVVNGIGGVRFTSKAEGNNNSIFLPFAGVYGGDMHSFYFGCGNQPHGEYWSNEINSDKPYLAYILYFDDKDHTQDPGVFPNGVVGSEIVFHNSGGDDVIEFVRNQGRPVRAVYDPNLNK